MKHVYMATLGAMFLSGCAAVELQPGSWTLRAPDGSTSTVEVSSLREHEYYLRAPGLSIAGVYTFQDGELYMAAPDNPRMAGYVWKLGHDGVLVLVQEPPVPVSGVRLTSATMRKTR